MTRNSRNTKISVINQWRSTECSSLDADFQQRSSNSDFQPLSPKAVGLGSKVSKVVLSQKRRTMDFPSSKLPSKRHDGARSCRIALRTGWRLGNGSERKAGTARLGAVPMCFSLDGGSWVTRKTTWGGGASNFGILNMGD